MPIGIRHLKEPGPGAETGTCGAPARATAWVAGDAAGAVTVPADARPLPGDAFKARRLKGMVSTLPDLMDEEAR
jgi:hypothetical protein